MAKKCIPGVVCVENMTLFMLFVIFLLMLFIYFNLFNRREHSVVVMPAQHIAQPHVMLSGVATRNDPLNDPYAPPLKSDGYFFRTDSSDIRGVPGIPVNVNPRGGMQTGYAQVGILTRSHGRDNMILPLMGRRSMSSSHKWQYYTISNTGNMNTKLPVSSNGKSCTQEYGCDEINNNDSVYVEGYKDTFIATVYENGTFSYIPYI